MTDQENNLPQHKDDFGRVYDLDDPSPYFTALRPADYRMPAVLAAALKSIFGKTVKAREADDSLKLLDLGCGYGVVGALLRHDVSMSDLYAHFGARSWEPADGRSYWASDAGYFAKRCDTQRRYEIGGIDIAGVALEYAEALGFIDEAFHENLLDHRPSPAFEGFIQGLDVVVGKRLAGWRAASGLRPHSRCR